MVLALAVAVALLLGDARPGWCPFSEPSPGAGIRFPQSVSPPEAIPPSPGPPLYPVFDRAREVAPGPRPTSSNGAPPMSQASGKPNAWGHPATPPPPSSVWMGSPLWIVSAVLLLGLIGLGPWLWMRASARDTSLPDDIAPRSWRGWTQRAPGTRDDA